MLKITQKMEKTIDEKEIKIKKLNELCRQAVALEIKESNKRVQIMNRLENQARKEGKKVTDKTKTATCDAELKSEMGQIKHLHNNIASLKREIEICNDRISLCRNVIRELELPHS